MDVVAWALGPLTFGAPMLLWGALGAAAPVLIHLVLRPRPRRQPFPAIRFILQSREASERTNRLRRLLLLLMRMAAIACLAMLLAQPRVRAARWVPIDSGPISVAICLDDSASMAYRFQGKTRLEVAKEWAGSLVNDRSRFGDDSEFVVLTAAPEFAERSAAALSTARNTILREIESVRQRAHDRPVGRMIRRADELLTKARHPRREIYVFSDSTLRAWRDVTGPPLALTSSAAVFCIDVGAEEDLNTTLTLASVPKHAVPADTPIRLELAVRAGRDGPRGVTPTIEVRVDDQPRLRCPLPPTGTDEPAGELPPGQTI
ncbi:MAG: vWA domain-containing protein, partial [Phycisphaerae bacterium]